MPDDDAPIADELERLVLAHQREFWRLLEGTGTNEQRDEALKTFVVAAWGLGYRRGIKRGAKLLAEVGS